MSQDIPNPLDPSILRGGTPRFLVALLTAMAGALEVEAAADEAAQAEADAEWEAGAEQRAELDRRANYVNALLDRVNGLGQIRALAATFGDHDRVSKCEELAEPLLDALLTSWCDEVERTFGTDLDGDGVIGSEPPPETGETGPDTEV